MAGVSRKRPVYDPFHRDYDQEIQDAVAVLDPHHFPISTWTSASIFQMHISVTTWMRPLKIVLSISNPDELAQTLEIGYFRGFWIENASCTPRQFYDFCMWLRSPDGKKAKDDVYFQLRLKRKPKKVLSASEKKRKIRLHYELRIAQLQKQILKLQLDKEEEIQKLQDEEDKMKDQKETDEEEIQKQVQNLQQEREEEIQKLQDEEDTIMKWQQKMHDELPSLRRTG